MSDGALDDSKEVAESTELQERVPLLSDSTAIVPDSDVARSDANAETPVGLPGVIPFDPEKAKAELAALGLSTEPTGMPEEIESLKVWDDKGNTQIHTAAADPNFSDKLLQMVRTAGVDCLFWRNQREQIPLHKALAYLDISVSFPLIDLARLRNPDVAQLPDNGGNTFVHTASQNKVSPHATAELAKKLGADCLGWKDLRSQTPLHASAWWQYSMTVKALAELALKYNPESLLVHDENGNTFVHVAAWVSHDEYMMHEVMKVLNAGILSEVDLCDKSPVHLTVERRTVDVVLFVVELALRDNPQCLKIRDFRGDTYLHYAAKIPRYDEVIIELLKIVDKSGIYLKNNKDETPLHQAIEFRSFQVVSELLDIALKENPDSLQLKVKDGDTCVHFAARNEKDSQTVLEVVKRAGVTSLTWKNKKNQTPLHIAVQFQSPETVSELIRLALNLDPECLKIPDENDNTCVHFAAERFQDNMILEVLQQTESESLCNWTNESGQAPLHLALQSQDAETVATLVDMAMKFDLNSVKAVDKTGGSCVHYAAKNTQSKEAILAAVKKTGAASLLWTDSTNVTPLHLTVRHQCADTIGQIIDIALKEGRECLKMQDGNGDTPVHYSALNKSDKEAIFEVVKRSGVASLCWKNRKNKTPLHIATELMDAESVLKLVEMARRVTTDCLQIADDDGNSCEHFAAQNTNDGTTFLKILELTNFSGLGLMNKASECPLQIALQYPRQGAWFTGLQFILKGLIDGSIPKNFDPSQYPLLHALFMPKFDDYDYSSCSFSVRTEYEIHYGELIKLLVRLGVDPTLENLVGENFFHAPKSMPWWHLSGIVTLGAKDAELGLILKRCLYNSQGLHAIHAFAAKRYDVESFLKPLSKLSNITEENLMRLKVTKGLYAGANCLHFSCESGHRASIVFMLKKGLTLSMETDSGRTCFDFGYDKDNRDCLTKSAKECGQSDFSLLFLMDPPKRSIKLPDKLTARKILVLIADASDLSDLEANGQKRTFLEGELSSRTTGDPTVMSILDAAVVQDSQSILRSALSLNLIDSQEARNYTKFCQDKYDKMKRKREQESEDAGAVGTSDALFDDILASENPLMLEIAAYLDKINIMLDLLLTRQFDLIPCGLQLIIQLTPKVDGRKGRYEQLRKIRDRVTSIVVNCLDSMFVSANEEEKQLLFKYLKGEMNFPKDEATAFAAFSPATHENGADNAVSANKGTSSNPDLQVAFLPANHAHSSSVDESKSAGPRFPCRTSINEPVKYDSVLDLIEEADKDEIFATECVHQLVIQGWSTRTPDSLIPLLNLSAFYRFWISAIFFLVFLIVFAFHITSCMHPRDGTLVKEGISLAVLFLYALSFTVQEIDDIFGGKKLQTYTILTKEIRLPVYFDDRFNLFDLFAIAFMWAGMILNVITIASRNEDSNLSHTAQMILSTSFLLWGFRSVAFLYYSATIGPVISMLGSLLVNDLLPFLALIGVIFYSFGVFYFNLLFPMESSHVHDTGFIDVTTQILTVPIYMTFGFSDQFTYEPANSSDLRATDIEMGKIAHPAGHWWFYKVLIFVFLFLVNIVMMNLLIALFSLTVTRKAEKAQVIWRRKLYELLQDNQSTSVLPVPFSFIYYVLKFINNCRRPSGKKSEKPEFWWSAESCHIPADYLKFLDFQARCLRWARPKLLLGVSQSLSDIEELKGQGEQLMAMQEENGSVFARHSEQLGMLVDSIAEMRNRQSTMSARLDASLEAQTRASAESSDFNQRLQALTDGQAEMLRRVENQNEQLMSLMQNQRAVQELLIKVLRDQGVDV